MSQEPNQSEHYIVTARKWRPMTFAQIVGQDHISTTLKMRFCLEEFIMLICSLGQEV